MNLRFLILFLTLKSINCYSPKRQAQTSPSTFNNLKSKATDPVIPARYKIKSTTNYEDPSTTQTFAEYFPQVEYPESVVDSSKPFYISSSPFPNDVKSTFNALVAKEKSIAKTATDFNWTQGEKSKEKVPVTTQKVSENEITVTKGNEINSNDNGTNETLHEDITMAAVKKGSANDVIPNSDTDMAKLFPNMTPIEPSAERKDMDYVVELINNMDEVMKNLTSVKTPERDGDEQKTVHTVESECSDEFKLSSDMTPNNNDSIIELNGNSNLTEEHPEPIRNPLFEHSDTNYALTSLTTLLNEYITNAPSVEDMQSDFCSFGTIANETNTCTES